VQEQPLRHALGKVPEVTLLFWIVKVAATTLGETAGDAVTMSLDLGYLVGSVIFAALFALAVSAQIRAPRYHPALYWAVIVATTTFGTTLADFVDRSLGVGYAGGVAILVALLLASLYAWHHVVGAISVTDLRTRRAEVFYWLTIMMSQTLGTALGDWTADSAGLGFAGGALIFGGLLVLVAAAYYFTRISRTLLFWAAFVLTRPLGATLGDLLDKPHDEGGLALSRFVASFVIAAFMIACVAWMTSQRTRSRAGVR
jgi:uncharacterized membrane-anchored protein